MCVKLIKSTHALLCQLRVDVYAQFHYQGSNGLQGKEVMTKAHVIVD